MPSIIGPWVAESDTTTVDTVKNHELGARACDDAGNQYIYLQGVASTLAGSAVTFDEAHLTTLAVADGVGRVAIAMAAIVASSYGWYLVYGTAAIAKVSSPCATDVQLFLTASPGSLSDNDVDGDAVICAISRNAPTAAASANAYTASPLTVEISYPHVCDVAIN